MGVNYNWKFVEKGGQLMFKKIFRGLFVLMAFIMMSNPAKAFYSDMDETHWAYQSIKFLTEVGVVVGSGHTNFYRNG